MRVLSLFDGISCGYEALLRAGFKIDKYYASEVDKYAIQVATKNHPDIIEIGDVTQVKGEDYKDVDIIIGGSPCQGFSLAGKQLNFDDPRSKLFFEFVRLLKEIQPKYFLLENVKMKKEFRDKISEIVGCEPILIDSALVSAQHRERLYWTNIPGITQPEDKGIVLRDMLLDEYPPKYNLTESQVNTIRRNFGAKGKILNEETSLIEKQTFPSRIKQIDGLDIKCPTLCSAMGTGGGNVPCIIPSKYFISKKHTDAMIRARSSGKLNLPDREGKCGTIIAGYYKTPQDGPYIAYAPGSREFEAQGFKEDKAPTLCARDYKDPKVVATKDEEQDGFVIRKLTPIECERLQTLGEVKKQYNILLNLNDSEWFLEQAKTYVNVEMKNHKSQNAVENVEKEEQKETALYAEKNSNINYQQTNKPVQKNVHTNGDEQKQAKLFLNEMGMYVNFVDKSLNLVNQDEIVDFVLGGADIAMLVEKIVQLGNDESREKDECCITLKNDIVQLKLSEKEIMQCVKDAKLDSTTVKKLFTSIKSNHLDLKSQEQTLITLFCYVLTAIVGLTHGKILNENSLTIETSFGYTYGVSDTQRYRQLGNGWTVDVIAHIFSFIPKE